jgi:hypothetical protein
LGAYGIDPANLEEVPCPLCGEQSEMVVTRQKDFVHGVDGSTLWNLKLCEQCHHYYVSPRPDGKSMERFYPKEYFFYNPSKLKTVVRNLLRHIASQAYIPDQKPGNFTYYPERHFLLQVIALGLLPLLSKRGLSAVASTCMTRQTYGVAIEPGMAFLEIGCGAGWDVHLTEPDLSIRALARSGVDCVAVEPSEACREQLMRDGVLSFATLSGVAEGQRSPFDIIRLNWSLEHMHDPVGLFTGLRELCGMHTKMIVTVPNYDGISYRYAPECIEAPLHLQYFTPDSIKKLCSLTGFHLERLHSFCTPSLLASVISFKEHKDPDTVLWRERRRILKLMDEAHQRDKGDELFCLITPSLASRQQDDS